MDIFKIIEILGLLFGIAYVVGIILEKNWCWYAGIAATIFYGLGVYFAKLYGEFILQFFYLGISIYGLVLWQKKDTHITLDLNETKEELSISTSSLSFLGSVILLGFVSTIAFYFLLVYFNGSLPFWDALTSGFGVSTTYMAAKKKIENWIFWIVIDIILAIILYIKGMPFYSILYIVYTIGAVIGYIAWQKDINKKALTN